MGKKYAKRKREAGLPTPAERQENLEKLRTALGMQQLRSDNLASNVEVLCLSGAAIVNIDGKTHTLSPGQTIYVRTHG